MRPAARGNGAQVHGAHRAPAHHSFLGPLLDTPAAPHRIVNARSGKVVAAALTPAFDSRTRNQGLLGRDGMSPGEALLIAPCQAIHTWFMRFAIDVAFVAKDGRVVSLRERMRPWRMALALQAFSVVELPAGAIRDSETKVGDVLAIA